MSRSDLKLSVGQAHQIAKVLEQQSKPRNDIEGDLVHEWIDRFNGGRCKLAPTDCRRLSALMRAVCRPGTAAEQTELTSIVKRLQVGG